MKCLGMAKKRQPLANLSSLNHGLPRPAFNMAMDKCQRFVDRLRTPGEMRRMDVHEMENIEPMYAADHHVDVAQDALLAQDALPAQDAPSTEDALLSMEANDSARLDAPKQVYGVVSFGSLGFFNLNNLNEPSATASADDEESLGKEDSETEEYVDPEKDTEEQNDQTIVLEQQKANECTPADKSQADLDETGGTIGNKRRRVFGSPKVAKKKARKSTKVVRKDLAGKIKAKKDKKSDEAAKKGFKNVFLTVKFKLSALQTKAGTVPDFALFVKDDVHDATVVNSSKYARRYLSFVKGNIRDKFFSNQGISYNPDDFYMCENEIDLKEDIVGTYLKTNNNSAVVGEETTEQVEGTSMRRVEDTSDQVDKTSVSNHESNDEEEEDSANVISDTNSDVESTLDLFEMRTVAKKVSWGAPLREHSEHSDSSGGVHVYGRGADKPVDKKKKQKRSENKKYGKASSERTNNDILDSVDIVQRKDKGKAMPGGRGGKGRSSSRGRGGSTSTRRSRPRGS